MTRAIPLTYRAFRDMLDPQTKQEFYRVAAIIAVPTATLALLASLLIGNRFREVIAAIALPFVFGCMIFFAAWMVRARIAGRLPRDIEPLIPKSIRPAFRWWIIFRVGVSVALVLLLAGTIASGIAGYNLAAGLYAIVYVVILDIALKLVLGTAMNLVLLRRYRPS